MILVQEEMVSENIRNFSTPLRTIEITKTSFEFQALDRTLRIVAISDIHAPGYFKLLPDLIDMINSQSPDIVLIVGDTVDREGFEQHVSLFEKLNTGLGAFAVLGNWEHQSRLNLDLLWSEYQKAGVTLLVNEVVEVGGVHIYGLDDLIAGDPDFSPLESLAAGEPPLVILSHCPEGFDNISRLIHKRSLTISGHTHGGQIAPFGKALITPKGSGRYVKGWFSNAEHALYVMRGVGTNGIPFRIGAKPEMLVVDIK